jgi:superfamily II DNA/RNA helicase
MDFIESGKLATDGVKFFVLDEADRLLDKGSQDLVLKLFSKLPKAATGTQRLQVHALSVWDHTAVQGCYAVDVRGWCLLLMSAVLKAVPDYHIRICTVATSSRFSSKRVLDMAGSILLC